MDGDSYRCVRRAEHASRDETADAHRRVDGRHDEHGPRERGDRHEPPSSYERSCDDHRWNHVLMLGSRGLTTR
jgi:hypothetical protein